jgi:hypothetical protein
VTRRFLVAKAPTFRLDIGQHHDDGAAVGTILVALVF